MPATNQGGGYTLTFSKKNQDAKEFIDKIHEEKKIKVTDYICECVRYYENNKHNNTTVNTVDENSIKDLVEKHVLEILKKENISNKENIKEINLEDNLDEVDIEED